MRRILLYGMAALFITVCEANDGDGLLALHEKIYDNFARNSGLQMAEARVRMNMQSVYGMFLTSLIGDENGKCVEKEKSTQYFLEIEKYRGRAARDNAEATQNILKKYCGDVDGFHHFFEKNVVNEFGRRHGTSITMDSIDGTSNWVHLGIKKEDIHKWKEHGFSYLDTKRWTDARVYDIETVFKWKNLGINGNDLIKWKWEVGSNDMETVRAWMAFGAKDAYDAGMMKRDGKSPFVSTEKEQPQVKDELQVQNSGALESSQKYPDCFVVNVKEGSALKILERLDSKNIVGTLSPDENGVGMVGCLGIYDGSVWCKVRHNSIEGWVPSENVVLISSEYEPYRVTKVAMNDTLIVRKGIGTKTPKVGELSPDTRGISVLSCGTDNSKKGWCKIETPELSGWVRSKYLAEDVYVDTGYR